MRLYNEYDIVAEWCINNADAYAYQAYIIYLKKSYTLRNSFIRTEIKSFQITNCYLDEITIEVLVRDRDIESLESIDSSIYLTFMLVNPAFCAIIFRFFSPKTHKCCVLKSNSLS